MQSSTLYFEGHGHPIVLSEKTEHGGVEINAIENFVVDLLS
jgi:hypothetical protein